MEPSEIAERAQATRDDITRKMNMHLADRFAVVPPRPGDGREPVEIVNRYSINPTKRSTWAIVWGPRVLLRSGKWVFEPRPSERTRDFIRDTRFTLSEAFDIWEMHREGLGF